MIRFFVTGSSRGDFDAGFGPEDLRNVEKFVVARVAERPISKRSGWFIGKYLA